MEIDRGRLKAALEGILFVAGEPVTLSRLAQALEVPLGTIQEALTELSAEYAQRGLVIQRSDRAVQMATSPRVASQVERFLGLRTGIRLSAAALETLAMIAYRQPITRAEIEAIRGVDCSSVLQNLLARNLIREVDRLDQAGRPIRYGTTFEFLQHFGLSDLSQLPKVEELPPPIDSRTLEFEGRSGERGGAEGSPQGTR